MTTDTQYVIPELIFISITTVELPRFSFSVVQAVGVVVVVFVVESLPKIIMRIISYVSR